ncbi:hypothetical protein ACFFGQ_05230, partial [Rufibacter quisquiliarum]
PRRHPTSTMRAGRLLALFVRLQLNKLKKITKIVATNWIHLVGFYITTYLSILIFKLLGVPQYEGGRWGQALLLSIVSVPFLFLTYGLMIMAGIFSALTFLDLVLFRLIKSKIRTILLVEWIIIVPIFIYWAFEYEYWLWITLALSFFVTQYLRDKKIKKIVA